MKKLTLLLLLLFTFTIYSQNDSNITFGLPELKIKQNEKGKTVEYIFDNSLNKFILTPETLYPDTNKYSYSVKLADIKRISFYSGTDFWNTAGVIGAAGFVLGFLVVGAVGIIWSDNHTFNVGAGFIGGFAFAIPTALVGGIFGALSPRYDNYETVKLNNSEKYELLKRLFKKYQPKR